MGRCLDELIGHRDGAIGNNEKIQVNSLAIGNLENIVIATIAVGKYSFAIVYFRKCLCHSYSLIYK